MFLRCWVVALLALFMSGPLWAQVTADLYSDTELEKLVEPVALYPDTLLTHVLTASTEPTQIRQANQLAQAGSTAPSDMPPSVAALMQFPDVLGMMVENSAWTDALGYAVAAQEDDVLRAVQQVRAKTQAAGNLSSSDQMQVAQEGDTIIIQSSSPDEVYVPIYDESLMYTTGAALLTYGTAVAVRNAYWSGACHWGGGMYYGPPGCYRGWGGAGYPPGVGAWAPRATPYAGRAAARPAVYNRTSNVAINNRTTNVAINNRTTNVAVNNRASNVAVNNRVSNTAVNNARGMNGMQYSRGVDARQASSRGMQSMGSSPGMRGGGARSGGARGGGGRR